METDVPGNAHSSKAGKIGRKSAGIPFESGSAGAATERPTATDAGGAGGDGATDVDWEAAPPSELLQEVECYMENIAAAATTNRKSLAALSKSNAQLEETNASQQTTITSLRAENKSL